MTGMSAATLMTTIKAVDRETARIQKACSQMDENDPALSGLEEDLLALSKAEAELRKVYEPMQRASDNLPLYQRLLAG